jgi:hypothetical protein
MAPRIRQGVPSKVQPPTGTGKPDSAHARRSRTHVQTRTGSLQEEDQFDLGLITGWANPRVAGGAGAGFVFPNQFGPLGSTLSFFDTVPSTIDSTATTHRLTEPPASCRMPLLSPFDFLDLHLTGAGRTV